MWKASQVDGPIPTDSDDPPSYLLNLDPALMKPELQQYVVAPVTPTCVFAGQETIFLRFPDEATAISVLPDFWVADAPNSDITVINQGEAG